MELRHALARLAERATFSETEMALVMGHIMDGQATPAQIGALLMGLRLRGETPTELAGAARAMRERAAPFRREERAVDTCGTGGDGASTLNISTLAGILIAGAGISVVKHGNRAVSSRAGSADVLEALGVRIEAPANVLERCLDQAGITFLFAPTFHAATRHAAGPRRELGTRTLFNLLGPLTNPAGVRNQVIGVFAFEYLDIVASALGALGARRAFVVHGYGGIDEVAVDGPTEIAEWRDGGVHRYTLEPHDFGLERADARDLRGGNAMENAAAIRRVLAGETSAFRTAALLEAALGVVASGQAADFPGAAAKVATALDGGGALRALERWIEASRAP